MNRLLFLFACFVFPTLTFAQSDFTKEDFLLDGAAQYLGNQCFRLVPDEPYTAGSLWYRRAIDLNLPLELTLKTMLGCKDASGADGIVLVFSPRPIRTGWSGEGMGFAGLSPSLGIEIDTWENDHLSDPAQDHIAIMANGNIRHYSSLAGPKVIPNIEDCTLHELTINWNPDEQRLSVTIDGRHQLTYKGDVVKNIFRNNSKVYWGITSATGRYSNKHEFCIEKIDFSAPIGSFDRAMMRALMNGDNVTLPSTSFASGSVAISPDARADAERLYRFLKEHPKHHVSIDAHTDNSGSASSNQSLSQKRAEAIADFLMKKGIRKERIRVNGHGERFPIADNNTASGRAKNRRVDIFVFIPQV